MPLNRIREEIYAPADGVILKIAESSHAVSLRCDSGVDLLIHVGMDTVERHGAGLLRRSGQANMSKADSFC